MLDVVLADWAFGVAVEPILDACGVEGVEANEVGLVVALGDVIEANRAIRHLSFMLICGKQIVKLFVQAAALLLALGVVCKDEDVSMWSELVLHGLSVVMGLENLV